MTDLRFTVDMAELRRKVNFVRNGLGASKTDLPVLLFRIDVTGNKATIFAANKEMFCRTEVKVANDAEDGSFSVLGNKIEKLISQVEAEQVSFQADSENLQLNAGFLTVNFELYDGSVLKTVEQGLQDHLNLEGLALDRSSLEEGLACAKSCTTTNSIRPDVTHVELRKGRILSSDGRKIMIYSHDGFPEEMAFKAPASALSSLISAIKNIDAENVQIIEGNSYYYVKANRNEYTLGIRKIERIFPAVEGQVAKAANPTDEISVDKHVLEAMLRGVALGLPSDEVKVNLEAKGTGAEAYVEVSATNSLGRRSHERASCGRKSTTTVTFPLSFKHLLDTLAVFKGDSVVDMMVMEKMNLLMVRDTTDAREVMTIIPFRTDKQVEQERAEAAAAAEARKKQEEEAAAKGEGQQEQDDTGDLTESAVERELEDVELA
jgi:hypothetical protein